MDAQSKVLIPFLLLLLPSGQPLLSMFLRRMQTSYGQWKRVQVMEPSRTTVIAVILLLLEAVCAVFDNVSTSAYPTDIGLLDHAAYLTIT